MNRRTRYFLFGSALIVLVGLATGAVAYYNGNLPLRGSTIGPAELSYVPADATAVAYANVRVIMSSEFRQRLRQVLPTGEEKDRLQAELGIDIEKDIDSVVAGVVGDAPDAAGALVLVRGRFDQAHIEAVAQQHGAAVETYKNIRMLVEPGQATSPDGTTSAASTGCVAFLEPGLVALGKSDAVKHAIDAAATSTNITSNHDLMKMIDDTENTGDAWVVGRVNGVEQAAGLPESVKTQIDAVQWFAASVRVDTGISGMVRAEARDEQAAEQLRAVINGGIAAGKLMAGNDAKFTTLLNSVQSTGTGKTVGVSFSLPPEVIDMINGVAGLHNLQHAPAPTPAPGSSK